MKSSIVTIIILFILSILVVGLMIFAYIQIIKNTKEMSKRGLLDEEMLKDKEKKEKKASRIVIDTLSIALTSVVVIFCGMGLYYKLSGDQFTLNNKTTMVIASNSMEDCISNEYKSQLVNNFQEYRNCSYDDADYYIKASQFNAGDMLEFTLLNGEEDLQLYNIYGYKNSKGEVIVHRLVDIKGDKYIFRGDNTPGNDLVVSRSQILYSYTNTHLGGVGYFVLFASSGFGIYSLVIVSAIFIMSDVAKHEYTKIKQNRIKEIEEKEKNED